MIKIKSRFGVYIIITVLVAAAAVYKIIYTNMIKYPVSPPSSYNINDVIEYNDMNITVTGAELFSGEELAKAFPNSDENLIDDSEIIISMNVKNNTDEEKYINLTAFAIEYDYLSGGGVNPYLFGFFNPDLKSLEIRAGEEMEVMLPYPLTGENPKLVLSLYPRKISVFI